MRFALAALALCTVLACSSSPSTSFPGAGPGSNGSGGGDDGGPGTGPGSDAGSLDPGAYPPGPYGSAPGFTLNHFTAQGYRLGPGQTDSTRLPWVTIDTDEYHQSPVCKCLVVTVGATWCGDCQAEQPMLTQEHAQDPSFCVLGILQADIGPSGNQQNATKADVDAWTQQFKQNFYVVQGTAVTMQDLVVGHGQGSVALPFSLVVRPDTMKVVGEVAGVNLQVHDYAMGLCNQ
ncbi:MAG TPA: hypothetical protein VIF15_06235 [Polyangiaceae bacterium]|jgi:thiol-disulfide isomerase/thioredoxin